VCDPASTGFVRIARAWLVLPLRELGTGACRQPVRLRGVVLRGDEPVYSTASSPMGR
jgi:hypothetical protein